MNKKLLNAIFFSLLVLCHGKALGAAKKWNDVKREDESTCVIDLQGQWKFKLDAHDVGIKEQWYNKDFDNTIYLPGALQNQNYGNDITKDTKWIANTNSKSTWFTDEMYAKYRNEEVYYINNFQPKKHYVGAAWYKRNVFIPKSYNDKKVVISLERVHWQSQLWVNGTLVDSCYSLLAPHNYDIGKYLHYGKNNAICLRIDNSEILDIGVNAHSWGDQTMTAWNGIIGDMKIYVYDGLKVNNFQIYPNIADKKLHCKIHIDDLNNKANTYQLHYKLKLLSSSDYILDETIRIKADNDPQTLHFDIALQECVLWDEYNPNLYLIEVELRNKTAKQAISETFGIREVKTQDNRIWINNVERYFRGNVQCGSFPLTGYCAMDVEAWERILLKFKEYGMNHVRFHSWCPPKAAFVAADKLGLYLFVEMGMWTGIKTQEQQDFLEYEGKRCLQEYGNHPSFIMMGMGNELSAKKEITNYLLKQWKKDTRHLYTGLTSSLPSITDEYQFITNGFVRSNKGWPPTPESSFFHKNKPSSNFIFYNAVNYKCPLFSHEVGQQCSYPSLDQDSKYVGSQKPGYLKIAQDQLKERGMYHQWKDFVMASGNFQYLMTKMEFESYRRTPKHSGYHLLQLEDFPGQGGALVGFLDYFYDEKPYINSNKFKQFNGEIILLASLEKFTWESDETLKFTCSVSNWSKSDLKDKVLQYEIKRENGEILFKKNLPQSSIKRGDAQVISEENVSLKDINKAEKLSLTMRIKDTDIYNNWDIWVYPGKLNIEKKCNYYKEWNDDIAAKIENGETAILQFHTKDLNANIPYCYLPVYWTQFDHMGNSQTMGLLCNPKHAVFKDFPTDYYSNYQWWELLNTTTPIQFDAYKMPNAWPIDFLPLIQLIDGWKTNRKLGVLAEAKLGNGKIIITSMDLDSDLENRIVARQLRYSIEKYIESQNFNPKILIDRKHIDALIYKPANKLASSIIKKVSVNTFERFYDATLAFDKDLSTFWHCGYSSTREQFPHIMLIELKDIYNVGALKYTPRQDKSTGRIKDYAVSISKDGKDWTPITKAQFDQSANVQSVDFQYFHACKFIKFEIQSSWDGLNSAITELEILHE